MEKKKTLSISSPDSRKKTRKENLPKRSFSPAPGAHFYIYHADLALQAFLLWPSHSQHRTECIQPELVTAPRRYRVEIRRRTRPRDSTDWADKLFDSFVTRRRVRGHLLSNTKWRYTLAADEKPRFYYTRTNNFPFRPRSSRVDNAIMEVTRAFQLWPIILNFWFNHLDFLFSFDLNTFVCALHLRIIHLKH